MKYCTSIVLLLISLNTFAQDSILIDRTINQLGLDQSKIDYGLITLKARPNNATETILVIPEIAVEEEDYFELNSYILLVNTETGEIINELFESSKENGWVSDAVILSEIIIDTAPYKVRGEDRAFGIRVKHHSLSQPNPYSNETISLYLTKDDSLKKVLDTYDVMNYHGEWDTDCYGESTSENKVLIISSKKTNGYYDILVQNEITETESGRDENGECISVDVISTTTSVLKFNNDEYQ